MRISKLCVCNNCNNLYIDTNPSDEQNFIDHFVNESLTCDHCCPVCLVDEYLQDVIDKKHYNCLKK